MSSDALDADARAALMRDLETTVDDHLDDDGVVGDHSAHIITACRT